MGQPFFSYYLAVWQKMLNFVAKKQTAVKYDDQRTQVSNRNTDLFRDYKRRLCICRQNRLGLEDNKGEQICVSEPPSSFWEVAVIVHPPFILCAEVFTDVKTRPECIKEVNESDFHARFLALFRLKYKGETYC